MNDTKSMIKNALILFAITLVAGVLLGLVYQVTKDPIAYQDKLAQDRANQSVFADAASFDDVALDEGAAAAISEEYTGVTLTVNRELQKDADGNDVTETYRSGVLDSEGTHTATYENPCVAAASGQAVADWLLVTANRRKKYAVKNRCDPAVESGDTLVIADAFHNDDRAVVTGLDIEFDGGLSCVTEADREF